MGREVVATFLRPRHQRQKHPNCTTRGITSTSTGRRWPRGRRFPCPRRGNALRSRRQSSTRTISPRCVGARKTGEVVSIPPGIQLAETPRRGQHRVSFDRPNSLLYIGLLCAKCATSQDQAVGSTRVPCVCTSWRDHLYGLEMRWRTTFPPSLARAWAGLMQMRFRSRHSLGTEVLGSLPRFFSPRNSILRTDVRTSMYSLEHFTAGLTVLGIVAQSVEKTKPRILPGVRLVCVTYVCARGWNRLAGMRWRSVFTCYLCASVSHAPFLSLYSFAWVSWGVGRVFHA